ncbi:MAG: hypothetical protein NZM31_10340 [Gemmatales bacterium]|nr:hypothetical protein [Gemmatales bacterium]MDW8387395.1 hypothetical protein [Gemmatales bacterium]
MRKAVVFLLLLAGCQSLNTPWDPRRPERADDPLLAPNEQRRKSRYLLAFPDMELGPRSGAGDVFPPVDPHQK